MITIGEYTDLFLTIMIGMGVIFEMPILVFFLSLMGIVTAGWMWRNLRYSILVIFIIAAIITPTTDILNMCMFAAPMVVLYILSIGIAWLVHPEQRQSPPSQKRSMIITRDHVGAGAPARPAERSSATASGKHGCARDSRWDLPVLADLALLSAAPHANPLTPLAPCSTPARSWPSARVPSAAPIIRNWRTTS